MKNICQACQERPIEAIEEEEPYQLCGACYHRLISFSLRPSEWYNLAAIFSPQMYHLHDDFYEDDGTAMQPEEEVVQPESYPAPTFAEVQHDIKQLLDYIMTRWFLEDEQIRALRQHDPQKLLQAVKNRFAQSPNTAIIDRLFEVAAYGLRHYAASWIRERWKQYDEEFLTVLAEASAHCLPHDEAIPLVLEKLTRTEEKELPLVAFACLHHFRSSLVLDWMEQHVTEFHDSWGRLAAASQPTSERMKEWLQRGRPFSLIALQAMVECIPRMGQKYHSKVLCTNYTELQSVLEEYCQRDSVPRVRQQVPYILKNREEIFQREERASH